MPLGSAIRVLLGMRLARRAGRWYRAIFVDLTREASAIATAIPRDAHVLDVGGGDGEPLNHLLALRPDLHITTLDPGPVVGQWIDACFNSRVTRLPNVLRRHTRHRLDDTEFRANAGMPILRLRCIAKALTIR